MRAENLNDGTVKAFLILILLAANAGLLAFSERSRSHLFPGSARDSRAVFGDFAENFPNPHAIFPEASAESPGVPRDSRALPGARSHSSHTP